MPSEVTRSPGLSTPSIRTRTADLTPRPAQVSTSAPAASQPRNPHLADRFQTNALRSQIEQQARANPSCYSDLVSTVNGLLQRGGVGISPASHQSVMRNLEQVNQRPWLQPLAHFREAGTFLRDAVESYRHGRYRQGTVELAGVITNSIAGGRVAMLAPEVPAACAIANVVTRSTR